MRAMRFWLICLTALVHFLAADSSDASAKGSPALKATTKDHCGGLLALNGNNKPPGVLGEPGSISGQGARALALIDLGLKNLTGDLPRFHQNLANLLQGPFETNPFENLQSSLGVALAHAYSKLPELFQDELANQKAAIRLHLGSEQEQETARARDRDVTSYVEVVLDLPNLLQHGGVVLGETDDHILVVRPVYKLTASQERAIVKVSRISKVDGSVFESVDISLSRTLGQLDIWMHDGWIMGIEYDERALDNHHVFRMNPETLTKKKSQPINYENGWMVRTFSKDRALAFKWQKQPNLPNLPNLPEIPNKLNGKEQLRVEVSTFNLQTLIMNPPHLVIDISDPGYGIDALEQNLQTVLSKAFAKPHQWAELSPEIKTDGMIVVTRSDATAWNQLGKEISLGSTDDQVGNHALLVNWTGDDGQSAGVHIPYQLRSRGPRLLLSPQALGGARYLVGVARSTHVSSDGRDPVDSRELEHLWIVNQKDASFMPVEIQGRLSGDWVEHWNTRGEYLVRFWSPEEKRVEIWKLDPQSAKFFMVNAQDTPCAADCMVKQIWIDWEKKTVAGWAIESLLNDRLFLITKRKLTRDIARADSEVAP